MGWITKNLTTHTPGTPLGVGQPTAWLFAQYTRHVVFEGFTSTGGNNGHLYELYSSASDDWYVKDLTDEAEGAGVDGNASGYIAATSGSQHVVYQGSLYDGHVHELWYTSDDGWNPNDLTNEGHAPLTLSQPFGFETHYDGSQRVTYHSRDRHIHVLSNSGNGWHDQNIGAQPGAPPCAADAAPTGYSFENQQTAHVLVRTEDGDVLEYWADAKGWHWNNLTVAAGAPAASDCETVHGYAFAGEGTQHVNYVGTDGHVHELWWNATGGWHHNDLSASTGAAPAALGSSPACYAFEAQMFQPSPTQHVMFCGADSFIHELWWKASGWHYNELTSAARGSIPVVGDAAAFVEVDNATQNVFYLSDAHQIIELRWKP